MLERVEVIGVLSCKALDVCLGNGCQLRKLLLLLSLGQGLRLLLLEGLYFLIEPLRQVANEADRVLIQRRWRLDFGCLLRPLLSQSDQLLQALIAGLQVAPVVLLGPPRPVFGFLAALPLLVQRRMRHHPGLALAILLALTALLLAGALLAFLLLLAFLALGAAQAFA